MRKRRKMYFQPIDELSLRHLFSSSFGENILKMSYIGPVLNPMNVPETSPDCLVLDKRGEKWKILRCEFKYTPIDKMDFAHNGKFDIAIVWDISVGLKKEKLLEELLNQNGCYEILVLKEIKAFKDLAEYHVPNLQELEGLDDLKSVILRMEFPTVFCAYIAAKIYPKTFSLERMSQLLSSRFPLVARIQPQGRQNVITALIQTKPPLLKRMHGRMYRWDDSINPYNAVKIIGELIKTRFEKELPDSDTIDSFKNEM